MKKRKKNEIISQGIIKFNQEIDAEQGFFDLILTLGYDAFYDQIDEEIRHICGEWYANLSERQFTRWSKKNSVIIFGGRKIILRHQRVRDLKNNKDIPLKTITEAQKIDLLQDRQFENMVIGVSTRKYKRSLEGNITDPQSYGTSKSSVSRNFIAKTEKMLLKWQNSPITRSFPIIMIDGINFTNHTIIVVLGIDNQGQKEVLGLKAGSTENSRICIDLLNELEERGLNMEAVKLGVIDGSKALRKAVREKFGNNFAVQRCQEHKIRNVLSYLPEEKKELIKFSIREAYQMRGYNDAHNHLCVIIKNLGKEYPSAASSLREGLEETLTLHKLDAAPSLRKSLRSTNQIENLMGTIRYVSKRVKKWKNSRMAMRWTLTGILEARKNFRRIHGYTKIENLLDSIKKNEKIRNRTA